MKMNDILNGILTATAGIAIFVKARTFPAIPGQRFGASFFPGVVGGTLVLAGSPSSRRCGRPGAS